MNLVSLDISTKSGWAFYLNGKLIRFGTLWANSVVGDHGLYPFNYVNWAEHTANRIFNEIVQPALDDKSKSEFGNTPLYIICEETTTSQNNYSQKKLEFLHFALIKKLGGLQVFYVRDGYWKGVVGARLNAAEREINRLVKEYKEDTGEKLAKLDLGDGRGYRVVGRITPQHCYIRALKEHFNLDLAVKDEDAAAAILLGLAFTRGVPICDGNTWGGVEKKEKKKKVKKEKKRAVGNKKRKAAAPKG